MRKQITLIAALLLLLSVVLAQYVPLIVTYQGKLLQDNQIVNGVKQMRFAIVDGSATVYWQNHASNTIAVPINNSIYVVRLGDTSISNMAAIPTNLFDKDFQLYIRVWVAGEQMSPDVAIVSVPYSLNSRQSELITANTSAGDSVVKALAKANQDLTTVIDIVSSGIVSGNSVRGDGTLIRNVDALNFSGQSLAYFATANHTHISFIHPTVFTSTINVSSVIGDSGSRIISGNIRGDGILLRNVDALKLGSQSITYFATANHTHSAFASANHTHSAFATANHTHINFSKEVTFVSTANFNSAIMIKGGKIVSANGVLTIEY